MGEDFVSSQSQTMSSTPVNGFSQTTPKPQPAVTKKHWNVPGSGKKIYTIIGVVIFGIAVVIFSLLFLNPHDIKILGLWAISVAFFFIMRLPDSWKMGAELFFLFTFIYSYAFGLFFVLPLVYVSFFLVTRIRYDEVQGVLVHFIILTGLAITAQQFRNWYGLAITPEQFMFAIMASIVGWLIIDTIITPRIAPVPVPKLIITHVLQIIVSYYTATFFGYKVLKILLGF